MKHILVSALIIILLMSSYALADDPFTWTPIDSKFSIIDYWDYGFEYGVARICNSDMSRYGLLSVTGEVLKKPRWDYANIFGEYGVVVFNMGNTLGLADLSGNTIAEPYWLTANVSPEFSDGLYPVNDPNGAGAGYINNRGELVIDYQYEFAGNFSEGLAEVRLDGKCLFINTSGEIQEELGTWGGAFQEFENGVATVYTDNDKFGAINREGEVIIEPLYDNLFNFEGEIFARHGEQMGVFALDGSVILPIEYDNISTINCGLRLVRKNGMDFYLTPEGERAFDNEWSHAEDFNAEGFAKVQDGEQGSIQMYGNVAVINTAGEVVQNPDCVYGNFVEGILGESYFTLIDERIYYMDKYDQPLTENTFDDIGNFCDGYCQVGVKDENGRMYYGYIDTTGNYALEPILNNASKFANGHAIAVNENNEYFILSINET